MALVDIFEPVLSGGIRNTNFFNGRLLTAEDLTDFQTANARQHQQLARAIGDGVVYGLNVTLSSSSTSKVVLHVTQGLGLNRNYQAVALPADIDLALVPAADTQNAEAGLFAVCQPPQNTLFTNPGLYILAATPASALSIESAPKVEVLDQGLASSCGSRWAVEGAKFRTVHLTLGTNPDPSSLAGQAAQLATQLNPMLDQLVGLSGTAAAQLSTQIAPLMSKFRNLVAHLCFGTEKFATFPANPFGRSNGDSLFAEYGALDDLRDQKLLTNCDIPLALLYWTETGLQFIDTWSVRRPVFPEAVSSAWAPVSSRRRTAEGLATFLQFQDQINDLMQPGAGGTALTSVVATNYFQYLPAAGLLPIAGVQSFPGFSYPQFFINQTVRPNGPAFTRDAKFTAFISGSFLYPPIDLLSNELIWLYFVPGNTKLSNQSGGGSPYIVFAAASIPYQGDSRYNASYWNFSNYSLTTFEGGA